MKKSKMKTLFMSALALSGLGTTLVQSTANADTVAKTTTTKSDTKINSVDMIAQQMRNQGLNPDHISGKYVVRQGDTLSAISVAAHESMSKIAQDNHITNLDEIYVGQVLDLSYESTDVMQANANVSGIGGTGDKVAKASRTKAQVEATAMINQGSKANKVVSTLNVEKSSNVTTPSTGDNTSSGNTDTNKPADKPSTGDQGTSTTPSNPGTTTPSTGDNTSSGNTDANKPADKPSTGDQGTSTTPSNPGTTTPSTGDNTSSGNTDANKPADKPSTGDQGTSTTPSNPGTTTPSTGDNTGSGNTDANKPADKPSTGDQGGTTTPSNPDQGTDTDYNKGVVNSDGTVNYDAAMNQKGPWDGKSTQTDDFGNSEASREWEANHPGASMSGQTYADGSTSQVPDYGGNDPYYANQRTPEGYTQDQLNQANQEMQKNINASETFGDGIQWVSSDYKGEVVGTDQYNVDNPVNTPYENTEQHVGQIDANVVKQSYTNGLHGQTPTQTPDGAKYVSSTITNGSVNTGSDGLPNNQVHLTFYK